MNLHPNPLRWAIFVSGAFAMFPLFSANAQEATPEISPESTCAIDIRPAIAALNDAQEAADAGDAAGANAALAQAQVALDDLRAGCAAADVAAEIPALTGVYTDSEVGFSFAYPDGWEVTNTQSLEGAYTSVALSPADSSDGGSVKTIVVIVGTPFGLIAGAGLFNPENPVDQAISFSEAAEYLYSTMTTTLSGGTELPVEISVQEETTQGETSVFAFSVERSGEGTVFASVALARGDDASDANDVHVYAFTDSPDSTLAPLTRAIAESVRPVESESG